MVLGNDNHLRKNKVGPYTVYRNWPKMNQRPSIVNVNAESIKDLEKNREHSWHWI